MNWKYLLLVIGLFLITLVPIAYKTLVLRMDFFPTLKKDIWEIEFMAHIAGTPDKRVIEFPVPEASDRLLIQATQFQGKNLSLTIEKTKEGNFARLSGTSLQKTSAVYKVQIRAMEKIYQVPERDYSTFYPKSVEPFLTPIELGDEVEAEIFRLEQEIVQAQKNKVRVAKSLYYFVNEEIVSSKRSVGLEMALAHFRGSSKDKSNLLTILLRRQGIPARTVRGIDLKEGEETRRRYYYWNEVYLDGDWYPVAATAGYFGYVSTRMVPLFASIALEKKIQNEGSRVEIYAKRMLSDEFNAHQYKKELAKKGTTFLSFSPYTLPLSIQPGLKLLLLFAVGCVVLTFCRNIIGVKTFGIFFPILLALFFKSTSLAFGLGCFLIIILFGFLERYLLKGLHLLAVPRLSIILTFLVMSLLGFAILNNQYHFSAHNPTLLPIIITTMFIERFSIKMEEEGWKNTLISLMGTILISLLSFGLFSWKDLEIFVYTHPETLFAIIAILIVIGKYTGYRLFEVVRFREFLK